MTSTAYIVVHIDTTVTPPTVESMGIYGEENPTTDLKKAFTACVARVTGEDYHDAHHRAHEYFLREPLLAWVRKLPGAERYESTCSVCSATDICKESESWEERLCHKCFRHLGEPGVEPSSVTLSAMRSERARRCVW